MKKHLLIILLLTFFGLSVNAQCTSSQGANSGSVFVNDASIGTAAWGQPQNAQSSDNNYATISLPSSQPLSNYLKSTGFGFSIPTTASICGIEVNVERRKVIFAKNRVKDYSICVVKNNTVTGFNYASNLDWDTTDLVVTYGSNSDLWGTTWTPAEINNSSFGAAVSAERPAFWTFASYGLVDQITIKVFYDNSAGIANNTAGNDAIRIFPNPATNHLTIALGSNNRKVEVTITNITGKIIYSTTASETQKIEVNTKDFADGIYVVQIQAADFIGTKKLVIKK